MRFSLVLLVAGVLLAACVTPDVATRPQVDALSKDIDDLRSAISEQYEAVCAAQNEELNQQLEAQRKAAREARAKAKRASEQCKADVSKAAKKQTRGKKILMGEVENIYFIDEDKTIAARVDTGAETSSLGVYKLREFERDGRDWVRFKMSRKKSAPTYEYRVSKRVSIKQRVQDPNDIRAEIKMDIRVGGKRYSNQVFNLTDRSHLDYQAIFGRSFLQDIAIVDTALKFNLKER